MIIGKGKETILSKLRIITLIEANLQHVMRMFLGDEKEEMTENNNQFLIANYSSMKNYSIEFSHIREKINA